jgi:hypothetical protein
MDVGDVWLFMLLFGCLATLVGGMMWVWHMWDHLDWPGRMILPCLVVIVAFSFWVLAMWRRAVAAPPGTDAVEKVRKVGR